MKWLVPIITFASFLLVLLAIGAAPAPAGDLPEVPPVQVPPGAVVDDVRVECEADERICRFRISLESGGNLDLEVVRVGALPTAVPRTVRVPGPVRRIVRTVRPDPRVIIRTVRPEPRVVVRTETEVRTRTRTREVPGPTQTVTENAGPAIINNPRPTATVTVRPPPVESTADSVAPFVPEITVTDDPTPRPTETETEQVERPIRTVDTIEIPVPTAVTLGAGLVIGGIGLALLALYMVYVLGYKEGEGRSNKNLGDFLRDIRRRE